MANKMSSEILPRKASTTTNNAASGNAANNNMEDDDVVIHKETGMTDGAKPIDHHFLLADKPLEINMYDDGPQFDSAVDTEDNL